MLDNETVRNLLVTRDLVHQGLGLYFVPNGHTDDPDAFRAELAGGIGAPIRRNA